MGTIYLEAMVIPGSFAFLHIPGLSETVIPDGDILDVRSELNDQSSLKMIHLLFIHLELKSSDSSHISVKQIQNLYHGHLCHYRSINY